MAAFLLAWGAVAVITQSILLRETMVLSFAGEISWGIVLFAWLAGVGVGAWLGGVLVRRAASAARTLALTAGGFALAGPTSIFLLRGARVWLDVGPGQYVPMDAMFELSVLLVSPFGILIGLAFPLACEAARGPDESAGIGWVYLVESAGSLVGGLAFTFVLVGRIGELTLSAYCGVLLLAVAATWLRRHARTDRTLEAHELPSEAACKGPPSGNARHSALPLSLLIGACLLAGATIGAGSRLERWSALKRWRSFAAGQELRGSFDSRYQYLALGWRDGQYELYANGHPSASFPEPTAHRWSTQVALCQHPCPRRVLLLGGGFGGVLAEVLTHQCVRQVDYVELDPDILRLVRGHLPASDLKALDDPRVHIIHDDVRRFVRRAAGPYDLVLADFGPPASALAARFYTIEFHEQLARIMSPDGVLVFETESSPAELRPSSALTTAAIRDTLARVHAGVLVGWGERPLVLACKRPGVITTDRAVLARRLASRGVPRGHFAPEDFALDNQLDPQLTAKRQAEIEAVEPRIVSTDLHPRIYLLWLRRWEQQLRERDTRSLRDAEVAGPQAQRTVFAWLNRASPISTGAAILVPPGIWLAIRRLRHGRRRGLGAGAVLTSIASTGFASIAVEIVLLFAYQSLSGYVYEQVGAIIGVFMLGLVLGSAIMNRLLRRRTPARWWLVGIDGVLACVAASIPIAVVALDGLGATWGVALAICGMVAVAGMLGGAAFPLAARVHMILDGRAGRSASAVDAADHLGACAGAALTGILLAPALGIAATCLLLGALKSASGISVAAWAGPLAPGAEPAHGR
ncbi:MAG: hypothetical protein JXQ73_00585 [Phycisphaerae bacterium]|nr:hypothetical protein [Phycisphaerae bacterium]